MKKSRWGGPACPPDLEIFFPAFLLILLRSEFVAIFPVNFRFWAGGRYLYWLRNFDGEKWLVFEGESVEIVVNGEKNRHKKRPAEKVPVLLLKNQTYKEKQKNI